MSEDKGFEVVDKRKTGAEEEAEPAEEPEASEPTEEIPPTEEETRDHEEHAREATKPADVYTIITWMIGMLASSAWQTMGLQVAPGAHEIEKDLDQAKLAIDCVMALADRVSPHLDETGRRELRGVISDLQINFVNQSKDGG